MQRVWGAWGWRRTAHPAPKRCRPWLLQDCSVPNRLPVASAPLHVCTSINQMPDKAPAPTIIALAAMLTSRWVQRTQLKGVVQNSSISSEKGWQPCSLQLQGFSKGSLETRRSAMLLSKCWHHVFHDCPSQHSCTTSIDHVGPHCAAQHPSTQQKHHSSLCMRRHIQGIGCS